MIDPKPSPEPLWVGSTKEIRVEFISTNLWGLQSCHQHLTNHFLFFIANEQKALLGYRSPYPKIDASAGYKESSPGVLNGCKGALDDSPRYGRSTLKLGETSHIPRAQKTCLSAGHSLDIIHNYICLE